MQRAVVRLPMGKGRELPARAFVAALATALLLLVAPAAADAQRIAARLDTTIAFRATGTIELAVPTGSITVTGWDRDDIRVRGSSEQGDLELSLRGSTLTVRASAVRRRLGATRLELQVPRGVDVTMRSFSGALAIRGVRGDVAATATNGSIDAADLRGSASLTTVTGDIRGEDLGAVKATAVNGNVALRRVDGAVDATTTNGRILLSEVRSTSVRAGSVNGTVEFDGTFARNGTYTLQAHNGNVTLYLPERANATLQLGSFSGHIETDIPLTLDGGGMRTRQAYTFTLGNGGATITAQSHSGNILIRRAPRPNR